MTKLNVNNRLKRSIAFPIIIVIIWILLQLIEVITPYSFVHFGLIPRNVEGLGGILYAPFIHGGWQHLFFNAFPFIFLTFLLLFFESSYIRSYFNFISIYFLSGIILWLIGNSAIHIGASGVIYGLASFLVLNGILSRKIQQIIISVLVVIMYSGLIWGVFPGQRGISWMGHLSGFLAGLVVAYFNNKLKRKHTNTEEPQSNI